MSRNLNPHRLGHYYDLPPRWRWVLWPTLALSGGGTLLTLWLEKQSIAAAECVPLAALPGMAILLYWFDQLIFKATRPCQEDLGDPATLKEKQR